MCSCLFALNLKSAFFLVNTRMNAAVIAEVFVFEVECVHVHVEILVVVLAVEVLKQWKIGFPEEFQALINTLFKHIALFLYKYY